MPRPMAHYSLVRSPIVLKAAAHVNQAFLGTPYGASISLGRLFNQRFMIMLEANDGKVYYSQEDHLFNRKRTESKTEPAFLFKIVVAPPHDPILDNISYDEAICALSGQNDIPDDYAYNAAGWYAKRALFLAAFQQGKVGVEPNFDAINLVGAKVRYILHRPNHGLPHSMRAAATMPLILGFLEANKSTHEVTTLQLMMLFSVVGREDETGFHESGELGPGRARYQQFRATSGLAYLSYCKTQSDIYSQAEMDAHKDYQDALTVELMGFRDVHDALRGSVGQHINKDSLKEHILNDAPRLVEMGTLTPQEAEQLEAAPDKAAYANTLAETVRNQGRYVLDNPIPAVLVQFIKEYSSHLDGPNQLSEAERQTIDQALSDEEKEAVIKRMLPSLLLNPQRGPAIFGFIDKDKINDGLFCMNWAHSIELSRCYSLQPEHTVTLYELPPDIDIPDAHAEQNLMLRPDYSSIVSRMERKKGVVVFKSHMGHFYIRHTVGASLHYTEVIDDPNLLTKLSALDHKDETKLKHSDLLPHIDLPTSGPQCFGDMKVLIHICSQRSAGNWATFKTELDRLYDFFDSIKEMRLRTGDRMQFRLRSKEEFIAYLNDPSRDLERHFHEDRAAIPDRFADKLTARLLRGFFNDAHGINYDFENAFRLFQDAPFHDPSAEEPRNFPKEALQCARLLDSAQKPACALRTEDIPEIQDVTVDKPTNSVRLSFQSQEEKDSFLSYLGQIVQNPDIVNESAVNIKMPLEFYLFFRDNRLLKFKLEQAPQTHSEEETLVDLNSGEYAVLKLIQDHEAVVRLHNTLRTPQGERPYDVEILAMQRPGQTRRINNPERLAALPPRKRLKARQKIRDPQNPDDVVTRPRELEPGPPPPEYQQPHRLGLPKELMTDAIFAEQGGQKNTTFGKKASQTLLAPDGGTQLFPGIPKTRDRYFPIGILSDLKDMNPGKTAYVWTGRANTLSKHWIDSGRNKLRKGMTLAELRAFQKQSDNPHEHNELLLRARISAIRALTTRSNTLIDRLNLATQAKHIKEAYGISVPLVILDPAEPDCPKIYTETMIADDLREAVESIRRHNFPYDDTVVFVLREDNVTALPKDKDSQNEILQQMLTECGFDFESSQNPDSPVEERLSVKNPPSEDNTHIQHFLEALSLPGGNCTEQALLDHFSQLTAIPKKTQDEFFLKQVVLGNQHVIERLIQQNGYKPEEDVIERAMPIAYRNHGAAFTDFLSGILQTEWSPPKAPEPSTPRSDAMLLGELTKALGAFKHDAATLSQLFFQVQIINTNVHYLSLFYPQLQGQMKKIETIQSSFMHTLLEQVRLFDIREKALQKLIQRTHTATQTEIIQRRDEAQKLMSNEDNGFRRLIPAQTLKELEAATMEKIQPVTGFARPPNAMYKETIERVEKMARDLEKLRYYKALLTEMHEKILEHINKAPQGLRNTMTTALDTAINMESVDAAIEKASEELEELTSLLDSLAMFDERCCEGGLKERAEHAKQPVTLRLEERIAQQQRAQVQFKQYKYPMPYRFRTYAEIQRDLAKMSEESDLLKSQLRSQLLRQRALLMVDQGIRDAIPILAKQHTTMLADINQTISDLIQKIGRHQAETMPATEKLLREIHDHGHDFQALDDKARNLLGKIQGIPTIRIDESSVPSNPEWQVTIAQLFSSYTTLLEALEQEKLGDDLKLGEYIEQKNEQCSAFFSKSFKMDDLRAFYLLFQEMQKTLEATQSADMQRIKHAFTQASAGQKARIQQALQKLSPIERGSALAIPGIVDALKSKVTDHLPSFFKPAADSSTVSGKENKNKPGSGPGSHQ